MSDTSYDNEFLEKIDFLKNHPSYLPFVGKEYRNVGLKILHIGNCHYIEKSQDPNNRYGFEYFKNNWFKGKTEPLPDDYDLVRQMSDCVIKSWRAKVLTCKNAWNEYCFNTRNVVEEQLTAKRNKYNLVGTLRYKIFTTIIKILSDKPVGDYFWGKGKSRQIKSINVPKDNSEEAKKQTTRDKRKENYEKKLENYKNDVDAYNFVAFTDFHMIPSLIRGESSVLESYKKAAVSEGFTEKDAEKFYYDEIFKYSAEILDEIINILKPDIVLITSKPTGEDFLKYRKDNKLDTSNFIVVPHPNYPHGGAARIKYENDLKKKLSDIIERIGI